MCTAKTAKCWRTGWERPALRAGWLSSALAKSKENTRRRVNRHVGGHQFQSVCYILFRSFGSLFDISSTIWMMQKQSIITE
jgi:hypothetical protein